MPRTPHGHFRRIQSQAYLTTPDATRDSIYGARINYRIRDILTGIPTGAVADPVTGVDPLDVDGDASAIAAVAVTGRGSWPRDPNAPANQTCRGGFASGPTIAGTGAARTNGSPAPSGKAKVAEFDWNDAADVDDVAYGATLAPAHTYTPDGTYSVDITSYDALGRAAYEGSTAITVTA